MKTFQNLPSDLNSSLIYDYKEDTINFSRSKPTEWKENKRIHIPNSGLDSLDANFKVSRKEASRLFDECLALLKDGDKKGFDNLTNTEKQVLKSLQNRVNYVTLEPTYHQYADILILKYVLYSLYKKIFCMYDKSTSNNSARSILPESLL